MKALLLAGIVLVGGLSIALTVPRDDVASLLDLGADRLPPPPEVRLLSPQDGEGVGASVVLAGEALSTARDVIDVQYRVDDEAWQSVPNAPRGLLGAPFSLTLELGPGDHLLEARAWDGEAYSLPARALVRRDAPTVRIAEPLEGAGLAEGSIIVRGTVTGVASRVLVEAGNASTVASVTAGAWSASLPLGPGVHALRATALAGIPSLPDVATVAVGTPAPPALSILAPREGAAYGEAGDLACGGGCILFAGVSERATSVLARVDGFPAGEAELVPGGAWTFRLPALRLANGPHRATFEPLDHDGQAGAPREVAFVARTPLALALRGDVDPRATLVQLVFHASGEGADTAAWTLDDAPVGQGATIGFALETPGEHALSAQTVLPDGRAATASLSLYAYNRPPAASLDDAALVGADIRLAGAAHDMDGGIVSWRWEFGDGEGILHGGPSAFHRYRERGLYVANLTVTDDQGATALASTLVLVPNVIPVPNFTFTPERPTILDVVTFNDTSVDLDGLLASRGWTLSDGTTSDAQNFSHRFATRGEHVVALRIVDDEGDEALLSKIVEVVDIAPVAAFSWEPAVPRTMEEVLFSDRSTDVDGPIASWTWSFGNATDANASGRGAVHSFRSPGVHNVTLTVVDDAGLASTLTLPLVVADGEPTVTAVVVEPARPFAQDEVRLRSVAADREGSVVALAWEFGDGATSQETEPVHRYAKSGYYSGRVTVFDEAGLSTVFPFAVDVRNAPPTGSLALAEGGLAAFPTTLRFDATDVDGRIVLYRLDADGDAIFDCEGVDPTCTFTYATPGVYAATGWIEDDEGALTPMAFALDVAAPPSHLAPPLVRVESPVPHAQLTGDFLLRGDATGVRPIQKVELQLRNDTWAYSGTREPWRRANGGPVWSALVDTRGFADGAYELVVRATDEEGGEGYARVPIWVFNGARPSEVSLHILSPPDVLDRPLEVRGSAFHPQGVTSVRWRVDDDVWRYVSTSPLAFSVDLDPRQHAPGEHVLEVEAYRGPTEKASFVRTFVVPGAAPVLVVDEPPGRVAHALLAASGRIVGEGRVQWRLDNEVWRPLAPGPAWNLSEDTLDMRGGDHVLHLRAVSLDERLASPVKSYPVQIVNPPFDAPTVRPSAPPLIVDVPAPGIVWMLAAVLVVAVLSARRRLAP